MDIKYLYSSIFQQKLDRICLDYGFTEFDFYECSHNIECLHLEEREIISLSDAIDFNIALRSIKSNDVYIEGMISNPIKGYVKGQNIKVKISSLSNKRILFKFASKMLQIRCGIYNIREKFNIIDTAYLSDNELLSLKDYCSKLKLKSRELQLSKNARLGWFIKDFDELCSSLEIYRDCTNKTKIYSFLYDILVILNEVNDRGYGCCSGDIGKEKKTYIKNVLKAYETQSKKG